MVAERDRDALRAGARGAADAVHVALRDVRQVVVDDVADAVDVDAARRDVGRDQRASLPARNAPSTRSRWFCDLLPWIASADEAGVMQAASRPCRRRAWCG